mmetsp:Transcript_25051/g.67603  ORF Transcript_25051/g.67603 Transcript_25051/m.67603 type:complete len:253 (-) Transcript_25051:71-829(-)
MEASGMNLRRHLMRVAVDRILRRHNHYLARREPERPLARVVLDQNGRHTLDGSKHGAVNDHRPLEVVAALSVGSRGGRRGRGLIPKVEADRQLEIELHGGALVHTLHGVHHLDVNLRAVECAVLRIDLPRSLTRKLVHRLRERSLGLVPERNVTECLLWSRRKLQLVRHTERIVRVLHELKGGHHLILDLVLTAKDVRVVLLEPAYARKARESTRELVAVQHAEVRVAHGEVTVGAERVVEHEAVARTVHRL